MRENIGEWQNPLWAIALFAIRCTAAMVKQWQTLQLLSRARICESTSLQELHP
ncbi:MAG: hypothetical protein F6J93_34020 [Oscillatoria sp. SIO1A7]|nr:hypothetical protein [Oscillatoria sp. SIO1A7]